MLLPLDMEPETAVSVHQQNEASDLQDSEASQQTGHSATAKDRSEKGAQRGLVLSLSLLAGFSAAPGCFNSHKT